MTDPKHIEAIRSGVAHATAADIQEILRLRRTLPVATPAEIRAEQAAPGQLRPKAGQLIAQAAAEAPHDAPASAPLVPAPAPTGDTEIAAWLGEALPRLIARTQAVFTREAEGGLSEIWRDVQALITEVSTDVATGLPLVRGSEAKALVSAVVLFLFNHYAAARVGPIPAMLIRAGLPFLVQMVYDLVVTPALAKLRK